MMVMSDYSKTSGKYDWVLIDGFLSPNFGGHLIRFGTLASNSFSWETFLPVMPNGRVHELIEVPRDLSEFGCVLFSLSGERLSQLTTRRVSWFERTWRMANRVFDAFTRIQYPVRLACRVNALLIVFNLPEAYRRISVLRRVEDYGSWHRRYSLLDDGERAAISEAISKFSRRPHFHLLVRGGAANPAALAVTLDSIGQQLYGEYDCVVFGEVGEACVAGRGAAFSVVSDGAQQAWLNRMNTAVAGAAGNDWFFSIRAGDRLPAHALYWFAVELLERPGVSAMFSDHDVVDAAGKPISACFKPDWSLTHFRATNFVGDALVIKGAAIAAAGGGTVDCLKHGFYDLLLRVLDEASGEQVPAHVPAVLFNTAVGGAVDTSCADWEGAAVARHLQRQQIAATVVKLPGRFRRCRFTLPADPPLVSIIIPTRDCLRLLRRCVESLVTNTSYRRFEILVIDNRSREPETLDYLLSLTKYSCVRVLRYDRPFNYSAMNNFAVNAARGELVCLLNNDTEVISPDWLDEMVGHALQQGVGAVGAKLYYPDGRVQHAGDVVGAGGCANHMHSMIARDAPGYCNRALVAQELSAVTAACLLTWKSVYLAMGGLDARFLKVAFNDVDYCLKLGAAGYKVVWTPHAELFHHESVSRGKDRGWWKTLHAESEVFVMRRRWKHMMSNDPFYNPNLSYVRPDFSMGHFRQVEPPWRSKKENGWKV